MGIAHTTLRYSVRARGSSVFRVIENRMGEGVHCLLGIRGESVRFRKIWIVLWLLCTGYYYYYYEKFSDKYLPVITVRRRNIKMRLAYIIFSAMTRARESIYI